MGRGDGGGDRRAAAARGPVVGAVYSPDGKRILSWSYDWTLRLWDAPTGAAIGAPLRHEFWVWGAVYSPDGKRILSWSYDWTLRLWDAATGAAIGEPLRHEDRVGGAAYSPDGKRILSWSDDKTLKLWDAATGAAIGEPLRHEHWVRGAVYSPDGQRILSWSEDKTLRLWDVSWQGDNLFEIACNYTPMMSSKQEMDRLSKRYGVKIDEPICQPGVKIPAQNAAYEGTPLDSGVSLGVHESQSRLWENVVARSWPFWEHYYPALQRTFAHQLGWYRSISFIAPSTRWSARSSAPTLTK